MFSYYGSKSKIINYYPKPRFDKIIEPFAGSARYALKYFDRDVLLVDKYPVIIKIWEWLQQCSENDIMSLPELKKGETIKRQDFDCEGQFLLMGFLVSNGSAYPKKTATLFAVTHGFKRKKQFIAQSLFKIRHWEFKVDNYLNLENEEATWFIDPPYQFGGHEYKHSNKDIDFTMLANWCKGRKGQSIVCENKKADWLPFVKITSRCDNLSNAHKKRTVEAIWTNLDSSYSCHQGSLF